MRLLIVFALVLGTGCAHVEIGASSRMSTAPPPASGTSISSSSAGLQIHASGALAAVVLAGMLMSAAIEDVRNPRPFPSLSIFSDWTRREPPPPMDKARAVSEQDCTKPVDSSGNLRCR